MKRNEDISDDFSVGWDCGEWFARCAVPSVEDGCAVATNRVETDGSPAGVRRLRLVFETGRRGRVRSVSAKVVLPNATNDLFAAAGSDPYPYTQYPDIFSHTPRNRTGRNPTTGDGVTLGEYCDGLGIVIGRKANGLTVAHELGGRSELMIL